jgi:hypothetical protein
VYVKNKSVDVAREWFIPAHGLEVNDLSRQTISTSGESKSKHDPEDTDKLFHVLD